MADNLDDGEFWLPPQFLSDDDGDDSTTAPFSPKRKPSFLNNGEDSLFFPSEFPYGFACSDLSSPMDSLAASSETESDEDEQIFAELTRRMERSSLQLDSKPSENHNDNNLGRFVTGSPQSTLCAFGSDCKCRKGSNQGSPNAVCEVSSSSRAATLDLLHAAAGEVEMLRLNQQSVNINNNESIVPSRKSSPVTLPSQNNSVSTNHDLGFFPQPPFPQQQFQFSQFQMMRQQQIAKNQGTMYGGVQKQTGGVFQQIQPNQMTPNGVDGGNNNAALGLSSSAWPTLQHAKQQQIQSPHYGTAMIPFILGNGFVRRESSGTGVFLPRPVESRRKPAATALVPARVAQALNLNLEDYIVGCQQPKHLHRSNSTSNVENVVAPPKHRGKNVHSQQKRSRNNNISRPEPAAAAAVSNEIGLPQEWTY